jgi:hypothetical protein
LVAELRADDLVHADETSRFEHGRLVWLLVFTSANTEVFTIGRRSQTLLTDVLGARFHGPVCSQRACTFGRGV